MYPHRIRLLGPWDFEILPGAEAPASTPRRGRVTMPCSLKDAGLTGLSGPVRFTRHFGMPRSHDAGERYWLVFESSNKSIQVVLNDQPLADFAESGFFSLPATNHLRDRNLLEVTIDAADDRDGLVGETALEIRRAAYLERTKIERLPEGKLKATAELAGDVPEGIELYLLAERRSLGYLRVAGGRNQSVELLSDGPVSEDTTAARVELVLAGVVWFLAECRIE